MKRCTICKVDKPIADYNKRSTAKDGLQPHCRECSHARFKAYYHSNREKHYKEVKQNQAVYEKRNREFVLECKKQGCLFCPEKDPVCLDFHHLRDKKFSIATHAGCSLETLKAEIDKCIVVCSNCHRKIHAGHRLRTGAESPF